jgi:hypothetical protein
VTGAKYLAIEALERCKKLIGAGTYKLGASDKDADDLVFDCLSFCVRYGYGIAGHRPGFNRDWKEDWMTGATSSVIDDLNSNSAIEDAFHARELFELVTGPPQLGDIIAAPTIRLQGHPDPWVGHAVIVAGVERAHRRWDPQHPAFALLDVVECHGPDKTHPAIRMNNGTYFDGWRATWPKVQHRSWLLRVRV